MQRRFWWLMMSRAISTPTLVRWRSGQTLNVESVATLTDEVLF
jgi:hypothetical protein